MNVKALHFLAAGVGKIFVLHPKLQVTTQLQRHSFHAEMYSYIIHVEVKQTSSPYTTLSHKSRRSGVGMGCAIFSYTADCGDSRLVSPITVAPKLFIS